MSPNEIARSRLLDLHDAGRQNCDVIRNASRPVVLMIVGLVLFLGIHLLPTAPGLRGALAVRIGDKAYRGVFSLVSFVGLVLIVVGYRMAPNAVPLFTPLPAARSAAPLVVTLAFVLFAAANMRTHIRAALKHPMLIGLMLWSAVHLVANGDVAGTTVSYTHLTLPTIYSV